MGAERMTAGKGQGGPKPADNAKREELSWRIEAV